MKTKVSFVLALLLALNLLTRSGRAQPGCYDFGSTPVAATWEASYVPLGCTYLPHWPHSSWPQWHLYTPAHRRPGPHVGYNPGDARQLPRVLVTYRCTGFLFVPVMIDRVRFLGYVVDQPEYKCKQD